MWNSYFVRIAVITLGLSVVFFLSALSGPQGDTGLEIGVIFLIPIAIVALFVSAIVNSIRLAKNRKSNVADEHPWQSKISLLILLIILGVLIYLFVPHYWNLT